MEYDQSYRPIHEFVAMHKAKRLKLDLNAVFKSIKALLSKIHRHGIVHGDYRLNNIIARQSINDPFVLIDFKVIDFEFSGKVCSYDQLTAAVTRTVSSFLAGSMKLRSPYTELLFNLSPSSNVTESLKTFGVAEDCTAAIAVRIVPETLSDDSAAFECGLKTGLNCEIVEFSKLTEKCDWNEIKQLYKPTASETENQTRFIGEIVTLIATKNF